MAFAQPDPHIYSLYISNTVAKIYIFNHSPHSEIMRVSNVFKENDSITVPQGLSIFCLMRYKILREEVPTIDLGTSLHTDNAKQMLTILPTSDTRGCSLYISITSQGKVPDLATLTMQTIRTHSKLQKHGSLFTQFSKLLPLSLANAVSIEYKPLEFNSLTTYEPGRNWKCVCNKLQSCCQYIRENPRCCLGRQSHLLCQNTNISICIRELRF
jgi:hypothetical protein